MALRPELSPRIKWPNDVLIGGAKFCGVLPEVVGENPTRIAIGCGVNIAHAPQGTPYPVTSLGGGLAVDTVLAELDASLTRRLAQWDEGRGFAAIRSRLGNPRPWPRRQGHRDVGIAATHRHLQGSCRRWRAAARRGRRHHSFPSMRAKCPSPNSKP